MGSLWVSISSTERGMSKAAGLDGLPEQINPTSRGGAWKGETPNHEPWGSYPKKKKKKGKK